MKYTFKEIRASYPKEKSRSDGTLDHLLYRPLSYPLTWLALNLNLMPNTVSYFSIFVCATGFVLSFFNAPVYQISGICCFFLFAVLDCTDGNMARTMNGKNIVRANARFGSWVDAAAGYCAYTALLFSMGNTASYLSTPPLYTSKLIDPVTVAAAASSANMLMRAAVQSYKIAAQVDTKAAAGSSKRLSEEIGITGWMPVLYIAGYFSQVLPYIVYAYGIIYCGGCLATLLRLIRKIEKM